MRRSNSTLLFKASINPVQDEPSMDSAALGRSPAEDEAFSF